MKICYVKQRFNDKNKRTILSTLWGLAEVAAKAHYADSAHDETARKQREYSFALGYCRGIRVTMDENKARLDELIPAYKKLQAEVRKLRNKKRRKR